MTTTTTTNLTAATDADLQRQKADRANRGDRIRYNGRPATINNVNEGMIAGPHFNFTFTDERGGGMGWTSYRIINFETANADKNANA